MLKLVGLGMVVLCGVWAGVMAAMGLARTRTALHRLCQLVRAIAVEMRFSVSPVQALLTSLSQQPTYKAFSFLGQTAAALDQGVPLDLAWRQSLSADPAVPGCAKEILLGLGDELGASDLPGQAKTLEQYLHRLEECRQTWDQQCQPKQRLFCSMGILGGMLAAILLC